MVLPIDFIEDRETGEEQFPLDRETGEVTPRCLERTFSVTDAETGEMETLSLECPRRSRRGNTFRIPRELLLGVDVKVSPVAKAITGPKNETAIDQQLNPIILIVLPLLLVLPNWAAVGCFILEICLHAYAHEMTRRGKPCRHSPFRYLTSNICAYCLSDKYSQKISKLQDERKLKAINRKLQYCSYVERMSVVS